MHVPNKDNLRMMICQSYAQEGHLRECERLTVPLVHLVRPTTQLLRQKRPLSWSFSPHLLPRTRTHAHVLTHSQTARTTPWSENAHHRARSASNMFYFFYFFPKLCSFFAFLRVAVQSNLASEQQKAKMALFSPRWRGGQPEQSHFFGTLFLAPASNETPTHSRL